MVILEMIAKTRGCKNCFFYVKLSPFDYFLLDNGRSRDKKYFCLKMEKQLVHSGNYVNYWNRIWHFASVMAVPSHFNKYNNNWLVESANKWIRKICILQSKISLVFCWYTELYYKWEYTWFWLLHYMKHIAIQCTIILILILIIIIILLCILKIILNSHIHLH